MQFTPGSDRSRSPRWLVAALPPRPANHLTRTFPNIGELLTWPTLPTYPDSPGSEPSPSGMEHDRWTRPTKMQGETGNRDESSTFETPWLTLKVAKSNPRARFPIQALTHSSARGHLPGFDLSIRSTLGSFRITLLLRILAPFNQAVSSRHTHVHADTLTPNEAGPLPPSSTLVTSARDDRRSPTETEPATHLHTALPELPPFPPHRANPTALPAASFSPFAHKPARRSATDSQASVVRQDRHTQPASARFISCPD